VKREEDGGGLVVRWSGGEPAAAVASMGVHGRSMGWYLGPPGSPAPGSAVAEAQHALSSSPGGGDASFDTNTVIILAALLFALLFTLGLNQLAVPHPLGAPRVGGRGWRRRRRQGGGLKRRALRSLPVEMYAPTASTSGGRPTPRPAPRRRRRGRALLRRERERDASRQGSSGQRSEQRRETEED